MRRNKALAWLLLMVALLPAIFIAYVGHFSRMLSDDYCQFATASELGPWANVVYWWERWNGSYTVQFLNGILARFDTLALPLFPVFIVAALLAVLVLLFTKLLDIVQITRFPRLIALASSALIVFATITSFHKLESFLWYSASSRYALPLAGSVIVLAVIVQVLKRPRSDSWLVNSALICAVLCFIVAGLSELYAVFQGVLFAVLLLGTRLFLSTPRRRSPNILLGVSWSATAASFLVQVSAPGAALRLDSDVYAQVGLGTPLRTLPDLLAQSVDMSVRYMGSQAAFAGFMLLLSASLFLTLSLCGRSNSEKTVTPGKVTAIVPIFGGLVTQLILVPVLLMHTSDSQLVLGRYSYAYFLVICLNILQVVLYAALLVYRDRLDAALRKSETRMLAYVSAMLLAVLLLFALAQLRSIHYRAAVFLFASAFVLLMHLYLATEGHCHATRARIVCM